MAFVRFFKTWHKLFIAVFGALFILSGTIFAIRWAQGYRPSLGKKGPSMTGTGLLVVSSDPKGAQVFLNKKLTTATDDTLNLPPGTYDVEIKKDGYTPWKKTLTLIAELVTQTNAKIFPSVPNLTPLTYSGAAEPIPSPDGQKIVYKVTEASTDAKNGLWVVELSDSNLPIARASEPKQIAQNISNYNFIDSKLSWTPDSSQILAYWSDGPVVKNAVLLNATAMNEPDSIRDTSSRLPVLLSQWYADLDLKDQEKLKKLPDFMKEIATSSLFSYFSPDEFRLFYRPTQEVHIPDRLIADLPSESTQPENRDIKVDSLYVYDIKEDKNYRVGDASELKGTPTLPVVPKQKTGTASRLPQAAAVAVPPPEYWSGRLDGIASSSATATKPNTALPPVPENLELQLLRMLSDRYSPIWKESVQWFPTSEHLLERRDQSIGIVEYDGTNDVTIYNGPFAESFVYPWPNGTRLIILTKLNDGSPTNLYSIGLK